MPPSSIGGWPAPTPPPFAPPPGPGGASASWMPGRLRAALDPVTTQTMKALALIAHFERWRPPGVFAHMTVPDVAAGMRTRVMDPASIDQGPSSLCGPAVFVHRLLRQDPVAYVSFVIDLYTKGAATLGQLTVTAGADLRRFDPKPVSMTAVDWITLASVRDSENWFFDYQSAEDAFAGITLPSHLERWFRKVGYRHVFNKTSLTHDEDLTNLREADQLHASDHWVCLLINANALYKSSQDDLSLVPNHWVVLRSRIRFAPSIHFEVFTWGRGNYSVPEDPAQTMSVEDFLDHYHGFVAAKY